VTAPSKTFCILPWIHIYANPDGDVLPCCVGDYTKPMGNVRNTTIAEVFNNEKFKAMRNNMLQGKRCVECSACYRDEDDGNFSFRKHVNEQFEKYIPEAEHTNGDGTLDNFKLRYLDVRWSNICNFKCRSCSSTYSSSWAQEEGKKNVFIFAGGKTNDDLYEQFKQHFDTIEEYYFAGGEPLLMDKHYDILEYLIEHGRTDVKLRYNTNLSVLKYKNKSVLDLWKKFNKVYVGASLDHYGERAEYIREGTEWNTIENNLRQIRLETPHVELQTNTVVSIFNVSTLPEFIQYLIDNDLVNSKVYNPHFYNILNPNFYSFKLLPNDFKEHTIKKLQDFMIEQSGNVQYGIQNVINGLRSSKFTPELKTQLQDKTAHYDKIRNQNILETFPELEKVYK
jgi:radical SAM protein with 4Fe4S-binding SPASM domain